MASGKPGAVQCILVLTVRVMFLGPIGEHDGAISAFPHFAAACAGFSLRGVLGSAADFLGVSFMLHS